MDKMDYWDAFCSTGKINDYLSFKGELFKEESAFGYNRNDGTDIKGTEGWRS